MRILYASERPPYPFFLGGAARAAHMLLVRVAAMSNVTCTAVGSRDYAVSSWRYPDAAECATLGVRAVDEANGIRTCPFPPVRVSHGGHPDWTAIFPESLVAVGARGVSRPEQSRLLYGRAGFLVAAVWGLP